MSFSGVLSGHHGERGLYVVLQLCLRSSRLDEDQKKKFCQPEIRRGGVAQKFRSTRWLLVYRMVSSFTFDGDRLIEIVVLHAAVVDQVQSNSNHYR
jgi:hypothetical protein